MANSLSFGVKMVLKTARGSKTFEKIQAAMEAFEKPYRMMDRYLRPQLADGLDHGGRRFFKALSIWNPGPDNKGVHFRPHGLFDYFYRLPRGVSGSRAVRADNRTSTIQSFINSPVKTLDMAMDLYSASKIAKIQEYGGTRRAKGGKMAVPLAPDMKGAKFMYHSSGQLKSRYKMPQKLGLVPIKFKGAKGTQIYLCKTYKNRKVVPMYVLKASSTISDPHLQYTKLFDEMKPEFNKILDESLNKGLQKLREAE
jgi:hypothetical protein